MAAAGGARGARRVEPAAPGAPTDLLHSAYVRSVGKPTLCTHDRSNATIGRLGGLSLNRNRARPVCCVAAALLVVVALVGCGRHSGSDQPTAPQTTAGASSALGGPTPVGPGASQGAASGSAGPGEPSSSAMGQSTPDPVASELDQINQLINDINNSIQSSDSSSQGGE